MKQRVRFKVGADTVVGELYLPATPGPHGALVVAGPMSSVKEQVTGVYACALATRGFAVLSIDHRHYGESGGAPRQYEYFEHKVEDLRAAVSWLSKARKPSPSRSQSTTTSDTYRCSTAH